MAKSLRELLDEQNAAKKAAQEAPKVEASSEKALPQSIPNPPAKPLFAGIALLGSVSTETQKPVVAEESKPAQAINPVESKAETTISAEEFVTPNQPTLMPEGDEAQLKQSLVFLVESFPNPDQLRGAIVKIMTELKEKPHLVDLLYPDDIGTIVRSLRESHQITINVVEEKGSKKRKKAEEVDAFAAMLEGRGGISI